MKSIDILKMIASDFKKAYQHENGWNKALIWLDFLAALLNFSTGNWLGGVFMLALAFWMMSSAVNSLHLDEVLAYASTLEKLVELWHQEADCQLSKIRELSMKVKQLEGEEALSHQQTSLVLKEALAEEKKDTDESKKAEE